MPLSANDIQYQEFGPEGSVYPGHATTIAYLIMKSYASWEDASVRKPGESYPPALTNGAIPGAGGCVYSALGVLKFAFENGIEAALARGDSIWRGETDNCYKEKHAPGQAQADGIKDKFRELFAAWPRTTATPFPPDRTTS